MKRIYLLLFAIFVINVADAQWQSLNSPLSSIVNCLAIDSNKIFVGTYSNNSIYYSPDFGNNWSVIRSTDDSTIREYISSILLMDSTMYAASMGSYTHNPVDSSAFLGGVFKKTYDTNSSWTPLVNPYFNPMNVNFLKVYDGLVYLGYNYPGLNYGGRVAAMNSNENYWSECWELFLIGGARVLVANKDTCYMASTNSFGQDNLYGTAKIYLSSYYGQVCKNVTDWDLPQDSLIVTALAIDGNYVFAGTYGKGVYITQNNGVSWKAVNNGLTNKFINALVTKDSTIFVATNGGGVYLSMDKGNSWNQINKGLSEININTLNISADYIYAGGNGGGIYKLLLKDTINTSLNRILGGTTSGDGIYAYGYHCTIKATPDKGYGFVNWRENGNVISTDSIYTFTVTENRKMNANFLPLNNVTIYPNPVTNDLIIESNSIKEQRLEILNILGQNVYTSNINKKAIVNTSAFANGVYFVKLSNDKETEVRKFVKE
ncbi:MAG: T9SS type A sorting domain-containing protein [Bacteroidota bacterium]